MSIPRLFKKVSSKDSKSDLPPVKVPDEEMEIEITVSEEERMEVEETVPNIDEVELVAIMKEMVLEVRPLSPLAEEIEAKLNGEELEKVEVQEPYDPVHNWQLPNGETKQDKIQWKLVEIDVGRPCTAEMSDQTPRKIRGRAVRCRKCGTRRHLAKECMNISKKVVRKLSKDLGVNLKNINKSATEQALNELQDLLKTMPQPEEKPVEE